MATGPNLDHSQPCKVYHTGWAYWIGGHKTYRPRGSLSKKQHKLVILPSILIINWQGITFKTLDSVYMNNKLNVLLLLH